MSSPLPAFLAQAQDEASPWADAAHPIWRELVSGQRRCNLQFMAGKILLRRLERSVCDDPSPEHAAACARELQALYAKNRNMPAARNDVVSLTA